MEETARSHRPQPRALLDEKRQDVKYQADAEQKSRHAQAPAQRLLQDGRPFIEARGAVHKTDQDHKDRQVPVKGHGQEGGEDHVSAASPAPGGGSFFSGATRPYAGPANAS